MNTVKVLAKGQIVIPASIRKKFGIKPGLQLNIFEYNDIIYRKCSGGWISKAIRSNPNPVVVL